MCFPHLSPSAFEIPQTTGAEPHALKFALARRTYAELEDRWLAAAPSRRVPRCVAAGVRPATLRIGCPAGGHLALHCCLLIYNFRVADDPTATHVFARLVQYDCSNYCIEDRGESVTKPSTRLYDSCAWWTALTSAVIAALLCFRSASQLWLP